MTSRTAMSVERLVLHVPAMAAGEAQELGRQVAAALATRAVRSPGAPAGKIGTLRVALAAPSRDGDGALAGRIASAIADAAADQKAQR
jgi:hypothetical protein